MFYFKDSEYCNSETKTGPTGSFIKYVEKHSCYKAAEKLLLALAEKNKECAVQLFPPKRKKKSSVEFYFEEIELSEEEINCFLCIKAMTVRKMPLRSSSENTDTSVIMQKNAAILKQAG